MSNCLDFSCKAAPLECDPKDPEPESPFIRMGFIVDATGSRKVGWDDTQKAQAKMFHEIETKHSNQSLNLKLVHFGGGEVSEHDWVNNARDMESAMAPVKCRAGLTNIIPSLEKFLNDSVHQVQSIMVIGDAAEDDDRYLENIAKKLKKKDIKVYTYLDGKNADAEHTFKALSSITGGKFHEFSNQKELEEALVQTARETVVNRSHGMEAVRAERGYYELGTYSSAMPLLEKDNSYGMSQLSGEVVRDRPKAKVAVKSSSGKARGRKNPVVGSVSEIFTAVAVGLFVWQLAPEEVKKNVSQSMTKMDPKYILDYFKAPEEKSHASAMGIDDGKPFDGEDQTVSDGGGLFGQGRETIVLDGLYFDYDRASFPDGNDNETLIKMSEIFKRGRCKGYELIGHTDGKGTEKYNQSLSEQRAKSIRSILLSLGVLNIKTSGKGESQPLVSNDTAEGRKQNRRVEARCVR